MLKEDPLYNDSVSTSYKSTFSSKYIFGYSLSFFYEKKNHHFVTPTTHILNNYIEYWKKYK